VLLVDVVHVGEHGSDGCLVAVAHLPIGEEAQNCDYDGCDSHDHQGGCNPRIVVVGTYRKLGVGSCPGQQGEYSSAANADASPADLAYVRQGVGELRDSFTYSLPVGVPERKPILWTNWISDSADLPVFCDRAAIRGRQRFFSAAFRSGKSTPTQLAGPGYGPGVLSRSILVRTLDRGLEYRMNHP
jgi:hypothetical protein